MDVVSNCPLRVASLRWQARRGRWALTVVAKATYHLSPVACTLANEQEDPNEHENHWDDDPRRSVYSPSDLVPWKPAPEVVLVGHAFAPRGEPVSRLVARLIVGNVDKSIVVHGERSFAQDGSLRSGARFRRMPLRYERAAGGPDTTNPVGMARAKDTLGAVLLPNLEPPGLNITRADEFIEPIGYAPIAADWPTRRERLGRGAGQWTMDALRQEPVPEWLDQRFFMSAPPDQYLEELRPNERLVLENLHPDYVRLVTNLPGWEPRAFVERPRAAVAELSMTCDTLWIDTDRSICTLTWRAQIALDDPDQDGRVVIGMELQGRPLAWSDVAPQTPRRAETASSAERKQRTTIVSSPAQPPMAMPFTSAPPAWPSWLGSRPEGEQHPGDVRLDALGGTGTVDVQMPKDVIESAIARAEAAKAAALANPGDAARVPAPSEISPPTWIKRAPLSSVPEAPSFGAPPALPTSPPTLADAPGFGPPPALAQPPIVPQPLAAPSLTAPAMASLVMPAPAMTVGQRAAATTDAPGLGWLRAAPASPSTPLGSPSTDASATPAPAPVRPASSSDLRDAAARGVVAASNAAAAAAPSEPATSSNATSAARAANARPAARDHVDLLWYDADAAPRMLSHKALSEARPPRPQVTWSAGGESPPREPQDVKDRREVMAILSRGIPIEEAALNEAANAAYQDDGTYAAPLALIAGDLSFTFDEIETLRATVTVATPFVGNDKRLKDVVANGMEVLKSEWRVPGDIAEGVTRRIEEAFVQGQRAVAPNYLENSVEKILLEGRSYQKKKLFGASRIRALFSFGGSSAAIPTYLPEDLAEKLPLFRRFKAKLIVELRPQEDQYETHEGALLSLALGRLLRRS
ncbi:D-alanyl-D-alanine carboxypeptidase [Minicystis rosea]|nr:D-alanyl-D-alanine carboxypeptidase [Minicystis rosea]